MQSFRKSPHYAAARPQLLLTSRGPPRRRRRNTTLIRASSNLPHSSSVELPKPFGTVACSSRADPHFFYQEIFVAQCYLQHGIRLSRGGVVLDIGANIGLFALFAAERVGPEGRVTAVEPIPPTFEALQYNTQQQQQQQYRTITCLQAGVSDGGESEGDFTFYRNGSGWSTMLPDDAVLQDDVVRSVSNMVARPGEAGLNPAQAGLARVAATLARIPVVGSAALTSAATAFAARQVADKEVYRRCPLTTVHALMPPDRGAVELLKVDVEGAELLVLRGVQDWPRIQQVVLEVSDVDGRLEAVLSLLRTAGGFPERCITVVQDATLRGTSLHSVYCHRRQDEVVTML